MSRCSARHAEAPCQRVPLGPYERRVHHRPVTGHVQRVLAAQVQQPVQGGGPVRRDGVGARLGLAGLLDQVAAEDDLGAARGPRWRPPGTRTARSWPVWPGPTFASSTRTSPPRSRVHSPETWWRGAYQEVRRLGGVRPAARPLRTASARSLRTSPGQNAVDAHRAEDLRPRERRRPEDMVEVGVGEREMGHTVHRRAAGAPRRAAARPPRGSTPRRSSGPTRPRPPARPCSPSRAAGTGRPRASIRSHPSSSQVTVIRATLAVAPRAPGEGGRRRGRRQGSGRPRAGRTVPWPPRCRRPAVRVATTSYVPVGRKWPDIAGQVGTRRHDMAGPALPGVYPTAVHWAGERWHSPRAECQGESHRRATSGGVRGAQ